MARSRFDRLPPERREAILDVAADRFAEAGFDGASYNRLLEDLGLPKSSAYYLFEGKADLYAAVLDREAERLLAALPAPAAATDGAEGFWGGVRGWIAASVGFLAAHPRSARLLAGYIDAKRRGSVDLDARIGAVLEGAVEGLVGSGQGAGAVRGDLPNGLLVGLAGAALAVLDHHFLAALPTLPPAEAEATFDVYVDTLRRLLAPAGASR